MPPRRPRTLPEAIGYWIEELRIRAVDLATHTLIDDEDLEWAVKRVRQTMRFPERDVEDQKAVLSRAVVASVYGSNAYTLIEDLKEKLDAEQPGDPLPIAFNAALSMFLYVIFTYRDEEIGDVTLDKRAVESFRSHARELLHGIAGDDATCARTQGPKRRLDS